MAIDATPRNIDRLFSKVAARGPKAIKKLVTDLSFGARESMAKHAGDKLNFRSARSRNFVANERSFVFKVVTRGEEVTSTIEPKRAISNFLSKHTFPVTLRAQDNIELDTGDRLAFPINPTGRKLGRSRLPRALLQSGKAFVRGNVIVSANKRQNILFSLTQSIRTSKQLSFEEAVDRDLGRNIVRRANRILIKDLAKKGR